MRRKGILHTVEAVLAAILFLFFILTVSPQAGPDTAGEEQVDRRARNTLNVMDLNQTLRTPAENRSLEIVKNRVEELITARSVEVSGLFLNTTSDRATFSSSHTDNFHVNQSTVEKASLRVWYDEAVSPNISVNGNEVAALTGTISDYEEYDILNETSNNQNELDITVASSSTIGYSVNVYEREDTGEPPADTEVLTTSYVIGGQNATFSPVEVSILSWR